MIRDDVQYGSHWPHVASGLLVCGCPKSSEVRNFPFQENLEIICRKEYAVKNKYSAKYLNTYLGVNISTFWGKVSHLKMKMKAFKKSAKNSNNQLVICLFQKI